MGEDTSDMIMSQSKMRDTIMNATKVASNSFKGVDIQDQLGNYKSTFQIMLEIAQIWDEIKQNDLRTGDNRQNLLLEAIAGKNRANVAASIFSSPDVLQSAYNDSKNNYEGVADKELEKVMAGITAHLTQLKNAWQELWANAANRDTINAFIDLGTQIVKLINESGLLQSAFTTLFGGIVIKGLLTSNSLLVKYVQLLTQSKSAAEALSTVFANKEGKEVFGGAKQIGNILFGQKEKEATPEATPTEPIDQETAANERLTQSRLKAAAAAEAGQAATVASAAENATDATTKEADVLATDHLADAERRLAEADAAETVANSAQVDKQIAEIMNKALWSDPPKYDKRFSTVIDAGDEIMESAVGGTDALEELSSGMAAAKVEALDYSLEYVGGMEAIQVASITTGEEVITESALMSASLGEVGTAAEGMGVAVSGAFSSIAGFLTSPAVLFAAIPIAILYITKTLHDAQKEQQALIDQAKEASNAWNGQKDSLDDYTQKYKDLKTQLDNQNLSEAEQLSIKQEIYNLQKQITEEYGSAAEGVNLVNGKYQEQLELLTQIRTTEAKKDLAANYYGTNSPYKNAEKQMEELKQYQLNMYQLTDAERNKLTEGLEFDFTPNLQGIATLEMDALTAEKTLQELYDRLIAIKEGMSEEDWSKSNYSWLLASISSNIDQVNNITKENKDAYMTLLEELTDTTDNGMQIYNDLAQAKENYNLALLEGDIEKIDETKSAWEAAIQAKNDYLAEGGNEKLTPYFQPLEEGIDKTLERAYNIRKQLSTDESKTLVEQAFGTYKENKQIAKQDQKAVMDASKAVLKEWQKANKEGKKIDFGSEAMQRLSKAASNAKIPLSTILNSLQATGTTSGLQQMLDGTTVSTQELENAILSGDNAIADLAKSFGITFESPEEQLQAFVNQLGIMVGATSEASQQSGDALNHFFKDTSARIEQLSSLTSVIQHGISQTGLTFTKTLDDQGNEIASEVRSIIEAYKGFEGFDLGSLFEETATGIRLNMEEYRALAAMEEAEQERMYKINRAALENRLDTATTDQQRDAIQKQIIELDMLQTAYEGATSAFAKYLNQQNAGDYQDTYETIRDTAVKRGNELMEKGYTGTEEFRSIAQLFSYESLATASAKEVKEAYKTGLANVQKYLTEDARTGMKTFLNDLMQMPYDYGTYINKDLIAQMTEDEKQMIMEQTGMTKEELEAVEGYYVQFTDSQEEKLAEHLGISKDMLESFFSMLNALGFNIHFYKDGSDKDFTKLNEDIDSSKKRLMELKEVANDPNLVSKLEFNANELDTVDELQQKISDLEQLKTELPMGTDAYEEASRLIDDLKEKLERLEAHEYTPGIKLEDFDRAEESLNKVQEIFTKAKNRGIDLGEIDSSELKETANILASLPKEVITSYGIEYTDGDPEAMLNQLIELWKLDKGNLELGIKLKAEQLQQAEQEVERFTGANTHRDIEVGMKADIEYPSQEKIQNDVKEKTDNIKANIKSKVVVEENEAEEVAEEMKENPIEQGVEFAAENSASDVAQQAGFGDGSTVTQKTNTETNEVHNTTENYTATTSGFDVAQGVMETIRSTAAQGATLVLGVEGIESVISAKESIADLQKVASSNIRISISGDNSLFNKAHLDTMTKLTGLAETKTEPKITADNSNLKDKVEESKRALSGIEDKDVKITAVTTGQFSYIENWKKNIFDQLHNKTIRIHTNYTSSGKQPLTGGNSRGTVHAQGTIMSNGHAYANGLDPKWGLKQDENGALINELGAEIVASKDGTWRILNNGDPTFANLKRGDIK